MDIRYTEYEKNIHPLPSLGGGDVVVPPDDKEEVLEYGDDAGENTGKHKGPYSVLEIALI